MTMLKVRNIVSGYSGRPVLKNLSLHVAKGEIVAIIGANGAGKTTLLNSIAGLVKPDEGEVILSGKTLAQNRCSRLASLGCALVPEGRAHFFFNVCKRKPYTRSLLQFRKRKKAEYFKPS